MARASLAKWSAAETGRLFLWSPVAIGSGAAFYLSLRSEPSFLIAPGLALVAAAVAFWSAEFRLVARAILLLTLGFVAADWRTTAVAGPQLAEELRPTEVTGRLISVDEAPKMRRLIIELETVAGLAADELPERARITWRGKSFDALPGDRISFRAGLSPPPPPSVPGGFDFARQLYFQKIGALGYAVSAPVVLGDRAPDMRQAFGAAIEKARLALTRRILESAPGDGGALVAATITGKREAISEAAESALRDSGLAHLIAISGLNMALATGIIFFALRFGLALIGPIALRFPTKKWAAACALAAGFAYLLISGGDWSSERAFIMTSIFFVAILVDRQALSLRNVAVSALIILLVTPEAVIHPGFQMSFAAVTALIAAYEWHARRHDPDRSFSLIARAQRYVAGVTATDVVASTATSPFSLFHFNRAALFGLPANVISIPIMGFWVMPVAILALIAMPVGVDAPVWRLAAAGVDIIMNVARAVASRPGAVATIAQWPDVALVSLTLGGLWLCLQTAPWRLFGLAALPVAAIAVIATRAPDVFLTSDGDNAAIVSRDEQGQRRFAMFSPRKDKFSAGVWKEHVGLDVVKTPTLAMADIGRCDPAGCVAAADGLIIAFSRDPMGLRDDCARADLVIATYPAARRQARNCAAKLIDRRSAWNGGAHAVLIGTDGSIVVDAVNRKRGVRPWTQGSDKNH